MWFGTRSRGADDASLRLYCLPYAGRGSAYYIQWGRVLAPRIDVRPVLLPGRENRIGERSFTQMAALVGSLADAIERDANVPFALFGHSLGALIAFELARTLRRRGARMPLALIASGASSPTVPDPTPHVHASSDAVLLDELRALGGTPDIVFEEAELLALALPIFRADMTVYETYTCADEEPLDLPLHVLGGTRDPRVPRGDLLAWGGLTSGDFSIRMFEGDHYFIHPRERDVLATIVKLLSALG